MLNKTEKKFLDTKTFDIRKSKSGRWYDQKVTPDVMVAICLTIKDFCNGDSKRTFTKKDLWNSETFIHSMMFDFGKPSPQNPNARREYDKVVAQPIHVLCAAGLIIENSGSYQQVVNFKGLLERMSISEKECVEFLNYYIEKTLEDSGVMKAFDNFFNAQDKSAFDNLKQRYIQFTPKKYSDKYGYGGKTNFHKGFEYSGIF